MVDYLPANAHSMPPPAVQPVFVTDADDGNRKGPGAPNWNAVLIDFDMAIGEPAGPIDQDAIKGDAKAAAYRAEPVELFVRVFDGSQYGNGY